MEPRMGAMTSSRSRFCWAALATVAALIPWTQTSRARMITSRVTERISTKRIRFFAVSIAVELTMNLTFPQLGFQQYQLAQFQLRKISLLCWGFDAWRRDRAAIEFCILEDRATILSDLPIALFGLHFGFLGVLCRLGLLLCFG